MKWSLHRGLAVAIFFVGFLKVREVVAQAPTQAPEPDRTVLPIPPPRFQGTIGTTYKDSVAVAAPPLMPPAGAPNVLIVLIDDAGYGQSGTFGGLVPTPTLDKLAAGGLRYTRFHVTALCSPTRAALLTGRNHHAAGVGVITNWSTDFPGYSGSIPKSTALVSQVLRENGYATAAIGKWHLVPDGETTMAGPFDHWPTQQGFDYFYGFMNGETDQWHPELTEGTKPVEMAVPPGRESDYTLNEDLANKAIAWIHQQKSVAPDRPVFLYFAPGATHAPLQAPKSWIDKFRGQFDMGWDKYREVVLERQKKLGVVPADTVLTPRPAELQAWDSLTPDQKKVEARLMEVFAGFMAQIDHETGRVIEALRQTGQLDNTLVFYIAGDNGASLEGGLNGTPNTMEGVNGIEESTAEMLKHIDELGGPNTTPHYPVAWAWAGNTPFQWGKRIASHFGGTRDPLVIYWPERIKDVGGVRDQFHHVIDVAPTILEAAGIPAPREVNGVTQKKMDGVSMIYTFGDAKAADRRTTQYFEMMGNRAIYHEGWVGADRSGVLPWVYMNATDIVGPPWELYEVAKDYSESNDVAAKNPEKLKVMQDLFMEEAKKNDVLPLDPRKAGRDHVRPDPPGGRSFFTFYGGADHLYQAMAPWFEGHSHTITAYVDVPAKGADGVIASEGGLSSGFSLYLKDGRPTYTYNYFRRQITTIHGADKLPAGPAKITLQFDYDGGGTGKGAKVTLSVNDKKVAETRLTQTVPFVFSFEETFDVGQDSASPVGEYKSPNLFTGTIDRVEVRIVPTAASAAVQDRVREAEVRAALMAE